jgi:hypothetical protein
LTYGVPQTTYGVPTKPNRVSVWHQVNTGYQTSEGFNLDRNLLDKIGKIVLKHESENQAINPSHVYGAPLPHYGPPSHWPKKVVGIKLTNPWVKIKRFISKSNFFIISNRISV